MKTQETIIAEIEFDIHMTVKRRGLAYAGEHAGWLDCAAKRLLKVEDNAVRVELFMKIVRRALKLLRAVDDSNGSLQSVLWEGSRCFEVWKQICQSSDKSCLKAILKKIFMRGAIYYLMGTGNSRYYNDVHAHRRTLAEMAASVEDWETIEPQSSFDSDFAADFATRRTFWR